MYLKAVTFIAIFIISKFSFSKSNDADAVKFDKLELLLKKNSKYLNINIEYDKFQNEEYFLIFVKYKRL